MEMHSNYKFKVSVALCTYNGEKYIKQQLESIILQTHSVDEIVIGDDASNDNTIEIIKSTLNNTNIDFKIIKHKNNIGVSRNFMETIRACRGEIIITCDQDDIWYENKVEKLLEKFLDQETVLVFSDADLVNSTGKKYGIKLWDRLGVSKEIIENNYFDRMLKENIVTGATMAFRQDIVSKISDMPDYWHDGWIALNAVRFGKIKGISEALIAYRQHENNVVGAKKVGVFKKIKNYVVSFKYIKNFRKRQQRYYVAFYEDAKNDLAQEKLDSLVECINFWNTLVELDRMNLYEGINVIIKNLRESKYEKFFTGIKGGVRDILTMFHS